MPTCNSHKNRLKRVAIIKILKKTIPYSRPIAEFKFCISTIGTRTLVHAIAKLSIVQLKQKPYAIAIMIFSIHNKTARSKFHILFS